eukprot:GHVH01010391.1.p2 GENE.GHVH01010391.1~~GHVH01010391.1.p2  ORF type:complete len:275 (+),score=46.11 GHVH01010391.1:38-862(+)
MASSTTLATSTEGKKKKNGGWGIKIPKALKFGSSSKSKTSNSQKQPVLQVHQPLTVYDENRKKVKSKSSKSSNSLKMPKFKIPKALQFGGSSSAKSSAKTKRRERLIEIKEEERKDKKERTREKTKISRLSVAKQTFMKQGDLINSDLQALLGKSSEVMRSTRLELRTERNLLIEPLSDLEIQFEKQVTMCDRQHTQILESMTSVLERVLSGDTSRHHTGDAIERHRMAPLEWIDERMVELNLSWGLITWLQSWFLKFISLIAVDLAIQVIRIS